MGGKVNMKGLWGRGDQIGDFSPRWGEKKPVGRHGKREFER